MMTKDLQEYFDTYFTLFGSEGWRQFSEEVIQGISGLEQQTLQQDDEKVFHFNRGYLTAFNYILNYPKLVEQAYNDVQQGDEEDEDAVV
jgi:sulfur relay (sulfurtransferase) DsrC/TusE family protein